MSVTPTSPLGRGNELVRVALLAAEDAAREALARFELNDFGQWFKEDGSRVTHADLAVEETVRCALARLTPGVPVVAEEACTNSGTVRYPWPNCDRCVVDPIDGTENFSRGNPVWGTLIAFQSDGLTKAAVISAPALKDCWTAARGAGAFAGDRRIVVSRRGRSDGTFCYGGLHECPSREARDRLLATAEGFRCAWGWGNFWGHVQVALGSAEAALSHGVEIWDVAAPALLVREAGGISTDLNGNQNHLLSETLLTSNGHFHQRLIDDLRNPQSRPKPARPA